MNNREVEAVIRALMNVVRQETREPLEAEHRDDMQHLRWRAKQAEERLAECEDALLAWLADVEKIGMSATLDNDKLVCFARDIRRVRNLSPFPESIS